MKVIKLIVLLGIVFALVTFGGADFKLNQMSGSSNSAEVGEMMNQFMQQIGIPNLKAAPKSSVTSASDQEGRKKAAAPIADTDNLNSSDRQELDSLLDKVVK